MIYDGNFTTLRTWYWMYRKPGEYAELEYVDEVPELFGLPVHMVVRPARHSPHYVRPRVEPSDNPYMHMVQ